MRVVKFLLGSDQPSFVAAAAGVCIAWGNLVVLHMIYFSARPSPPVWQAIGAGIALGLFIMPFFFLCISRASRFMSPWEALATMTAVSLCPLMMWRLGAQEGLGVNPFLIIAGCIALVVGAFLAARAIVKRHRSSL
jgi:hypothetical protein